MQPLVFGPILKRSRWGGRRLGTMFGKRLGPESDYAESWEVADHAADQSIVVGGALDGWTLQRLVAERNAELFGRHAGRTQFPLLVKLLDANDRLSVQVHPNDAQAKQFDAAENGKTEAWVILHAEPGSRLYVGLRPGTDARTLRRHVEHGTVEEGLHVIEARVSDCVFVPAGTVHAIGEGIVLAEVQQSSDLTFRLYDWGRVGSDGRPRPLHVDEALQCIDFTRGPVGPVTPTRIQAAHHSLEELVRCERFVLRRHSAEQAFALPEDRQFHVLMLLAGAGTLAAGEDRVVLSPGRTALLPAERAAARFEPEGPCVVLDAFLP
jgi:mannose-6-phosphate isomerase